MTTNRMLLVFAAALCLAACKKDSGTEPPPPPTAAELVAQGWTAFAAGNFVTAKARFTSAIALDATIADAYNGAGWSDAHLGLLSEAETRFGEGRARPGATLDLLAGLSIVHNASKDYALSVLEADTLFTADAGWAFSRDTSVNSADVRVAVAESYYAMGNFSASMAAVVVLNPSFSADVLTVDGRTALAAEIERLRGVYE